MNRPVAPKALGAYSQTLVAGGLCFVSGQVPVDSEGNHPDPLDVTGQAETAFANLRACLGAEGLKLEDVMSLTTYLRDVADNPEVSAVRSRVFGQHRPTSTVVAVAELLHPHWRLEVQAIARVNGSDA